MKGEIEDFIILGVPSGTSLDQPGVREKLDRASERAIIGQYENVRPKAILLRDTDWIITSDWRLVEEFQPAHDCAKCRAANDQAMAFLKEHPEGCLALGNLHYLEVWT